MKIRNPKAHAGGARYSRLWTVINIVLLADLIVAAVAVSGVGVGASFWCGLYREIRLCKDRGFSRICLDIIRGRHDWIDGDETECFWKDIIEKEKVCPSDVSD